MFVKSYIEYQKKNKKKKQKKMEKGQKKNKKGKKKTPFQASLCERGPNEVKKTLKPFNLLQRSVSPAPQGFQVVLVFLFYLISMDISPRADDRNEPLNECSC